MNSIILKSRVLTITVLPQRGGKIASIRFLPRSFELLFQPPGSVYPNLTPGMPFHLGDASGFDDVFPSMGPETADMQGAALTIPDHGQLWTSPMTARLEREALALRCELSGSGYTYEKRIYLEEGRMCYDVTICNLRPEPLPAVWVCHCLMRYEPGMTFFFPQDAHIARNLISGSPLGKAGQLHVLGESDYDFAHPPKAHSAVKFYFQDTVSQGWCAADYPASGVRATMRFDPATLPYLGFWMTTGAYRGDWNFAFEPATSFYDTVACAQKNYRLARILPGRDLRLHLSLELTELN